MELSIEKLRSPRRRTSSSSSIFVDSASSTPFASAPSSPRYYAYYSAPSSPPRISSQDHSPGIPFSWEERPGTPKRSHSRSPNTELERDANSSVDHLAAMGLGFHFSAPVSPQREFDFMIQPRDNLLDDFEFSSARMSDADSVVSHADELFFQGQILPLKLPNRLHHHKSQSLSLSLQLQDFSPRTNDSFSPRPAPSSSFAEQLPSPKPVLKSPPRLSSPPPRSRSKSPSKLGRAAVKSSAGKSLRELLHLNSRRINGNGSLRSSGSDGKDGGSLRSSGSESAGSSRNGSLRSSGSDSRSSSGGSTSQRFSSSRSSSVSSVGGGVRSPCSSRRVSPVPSRELLQSYSKNHKDAEFRRKTFLPYRQGLLGFIGCISWPSLRKVQDLEY